MASESYGYTSVLVPPGQPAKVSWVATPLPGMVIEGYRSTFDLGGAIQPTSLADTTLIVSPPPNGVTYLYVEVEFDQGKRALYPLLIRFGGIGPTPTSNDQVVGLESHRRVDVLRSSSKAP